MALHLEIVPEPPTLSILVNDINLLFYVIREPADELANQRSHPPARSVNRNEPFGSILETANSHFSKLLTVFNPAAGRIRCAKQRITTGERLGSRQKSWRCVFA
jgi:hypothetical protein